MTAETRTYITLLEPGDDDSVGAIVDQDPIAVTDPRMLPLNDLLMGDPQPMEILIGGNSGHKLVTVVPLSGPVECDNGAAVWYEAPCWRVTGTAPWTAVFGPQGEEVIAALNLAAPMLRGTFGAEPPAVRYYDLAGKTRTQMAEALQSALDALEKVGADRAWWGEGAWSCSLYGPELVAIAARDLIGAVPGWTEAAHDILTAPYRAAFGDDAPSAAGAYEVDPEQP